MLNPSHPLIVASLLLIAPIAGCGGGSSSNPIIGKWIDKGGTGLTVDFEPASVTMNSDGKGFIVGVKATGVTTMTPEGREMLKVPVTYLIDGDMVHLQLKDGTPGNPNLKGFRINANQSVDAIYSNGVVWEYVHPSSSS